MNAILPATNPSISFAELRTRHREIVADLIDQVPIVAADDGHKAWTLAVKQVMQRIAKTESAQLEFYGTLHGDESKHREWLIDAIWYFRSSDGKGEALLLALESEWNRSQSEVVNDFCKLLAVKAPIKIMLFEGNLEAGKYIELLENAGRIWLQHERGDLIYAINFREGNHKTWFCEVESSGRIEDFKLQAIDKLTGPDNHS